MLVCPAYCDKHSELSVLSARSRYDWLMNCCIWRCSLVMLLKMFSTSTCNIYVRRGWRVWEE